MDSSIRKNSLAAAGCLVGLALCGACLVAPVEEGVSGNALLPSVAQAKDSVSKLVKNGVFVDSAADFSERLDDAFAEIGGCPLKVDGYKKMPKDGRLGVCLRDGSIAGLVTFGDANGFLKYSDRSESKAFDSVWIYVAEDEQQDEYAAYSLIGMIMACDPSLSLIDAADVAQDVLDSYDGESGSVLKNGIIYGFMSEDDMWLVVAVIAD